MANDGRMTAVNKLLKMREEWIVMQVVKVGEWVGLDRDPYAVQALLEIFKEAYKGGADDARAIHAQTMDPFEE